MVYKLRQLARLQFGKIIKVCFYDNKVYIYFTTETHTYEETRTKKHDGAGEVGKLKDKFKVVGMLIDIL